MKTTDTRTTLRHSPTLEAASYNPSATRTGNGIYTLSDLRDRCRIDSETGCWNWSLTTSGGKSGSVVPRVSIPVGVVGNDVIKHLTGPRASWLLSGRSMREGWIAWRACLNPLCLNPAHIKAGARADEGSWRQDVGTWRGDPLRARANMTSARKRALPPQSVETIEGMLADSMTRRAIESATGVTRTTIQRIADGQHIHQRDRLVRGASVFALGASA